MHLRRRSQALSLLEPLRERSYLRVWLGQLASSFGDQIYIVAIAVFLLDGGYGLRGVAMVLAAKVTASAIFTVAGGVLADRVRRSKVMLASDVIRASAVAGLALVPIGTPLSLLVLLSFVLGVGESLFRPAYNAITPVLVSKERLEQANALNSISFRVTGMIGPALGGVLVAGWSPQGALVVDVITFVVSGALLIGLSESVPVRGVRKNPFAEAVEGFSAVRERPWVLSILAVVSVHLSLLFPPLIVLLPVISTDRLGGSSAYATILSAFAVGAIVGGVLAGAWRPKHPGVVALVSLMPTGAVMLALSVPTHFVVIAGLYLLAGAGVDLFNVYWYSALQRAIPNELLGRVMSLDYLASAMLTPIGLIAVVPVVSAVGDRSVLVVAGAMLIVTALIPLCVPGVPRFGKELDSVESARAG